MLRPVSCKSVLVVALIVLSALLTLSAQTAPAPKYDKSSEVKVKGVIEEVTTAADNVVHLTLKTEKGSLDVVVAPEKFLKEMEITFAKGETVEVLGSQVMAGEATVMLAREVTRGGDIMMMRDDKGKPVWVGWPK
jgi:hypothetical protein